MVGVGHVIVLGFLAVTAYTAYWLGRQKGFQEGVSYRAAVDRKKHQM